MTSCDIKYASSAKPWLKYLPEGADQKPLPECSMYDWVKECNKDSLDIVAIDYYGAKYTYREMFAKAEHYAACFKALGVKKGEYVSFLSVVLPETVFAIYALNKLGAVCNFIDVRTDLSHIIEYFHKAQSDVLICVNAIFPKIADHLDELGAKKIIVQDAGQYIGGYRKLLLKLKASVPLPEDERIIKNVDFEKMGIGFKTDEVPYEKDYPAAVTRTGGTTGTSKGVVLTNDSMNAVAANFADYGIKYTKGDRLLNFLPLGASYGIACGVHMAFCMSLTNVFIPNFEASRFGDYVVKYKPNHIIGVPVFYENLMLNKKAQKMDLSFISTMAAGGDSANASLESKLREFCVSHGIVYPLAQGYGMSETSSACSWGVQYVHKDGSVGIPAPHSMMAVFKPGTTEELPIGESGELCITGATLMKEYLDEPEETANVMIKHPDGRVWVHSGDIAHMDEDGFVFIEGRIKRSIIRFDGHKVYPVQIETVANRHPAVKNCCVIPCKDIKHEQGFLPLVVAELIPGFEEHKKKVCAEIMELCKKGMEMRSWPCAAVTIDEMPITNNSKNDALKLTEIFGHYNYLKETKKAQ